MTEYNEYNNPVQEEKEEEAGYFCRFTFGQFFTILVLEVVTFAFVFYLGAKYGTNYLKISEDAVATRPGVTEVISGDSNQVIKPNLQAPPLSAQDSELQAMARDALKGAPDAELKDKVKSLLAKQNPDQPGQPSQEELLKRINELTNQQRANQVTNTGLPAQTVQQETIHQGQQGLPATLPAKPAEPREETSAMKADREVEEARSQPMQQPGQTSKPDNGVIRMKSPANGQFSIQVGSYPNMNEASAKVEDWRGKGYPAFMMIADIPDKGRWYRVRIGGFGSKEDAQGYLEKFKSNESTEGIIVLNEQ